MAAHVEDISKGEPIRDPEKEQLEPDIVKSTVVHDAKKCNISIHALRLIMVHLSYEVYIVSGLGRRNIDIILIDLYQTAHTSL